LTRTLFTISVFRLLVLKNRQLFAVFHCRSLQERIYLIEIKE